MVQWYSMWARLGTQRAREQTVMKDITPPSFLWPHRTEAGAVCRCVLSKVSPPQRDQYAVTGHDTADGCQSSSFSICLNASKSSRQSASSSSTDWLLESVSPSGSSLFSESLSSLGWAWSAELASSSGGLTSSAGLVSSSIGLFSSCDGVTSSGASSSSSTVLICDWLTGSNEVGVVASVVQSSSASCASTPEKKAGACDWPALYRNMFRIHTPTHTQTSFPPLLSEIYTTCPMVAILGQK